MARIKKRKEIIKLADTLDIVLVSLDPDYKKGDIFEDEPQPLVLHNSLGEGTQEFDASAKKWSDFLSNQLELYEKRLNLLSKSTINKESKKQDTQSNQVFRNVENYFHYNPVVNITTFMQYIDQAIIELEKETEIDSKTKTEIKTKLQQAKDFIKNIGDEAAPLAGKVIGQALHSFLFGNEK